MDSFSQVKTKSLECAICHERFKDPRILKECLHSFCCGCLMELTGGAATIICPLCQETINVPGGDVNNFPSNFQLSEIVQEAAMHDTLVKNAKVMCDCHQGEEETEAVARCFECNEYICNGGLDSHRRFKQLESHPIANLKDMRSGKVRPKGLMGTKQIWCKIHNQDEAKYFCESCDMQICHTCYNLDHYDRKRHKCQDLRTAIPKLRKCMANLSENLRKLAQEHEQIQEKNERTKQAIKDQAEHKKAVITVQIDEAKQRLDDERKACHDRIDARMAHELRTYQELASSLGRTIMQARNANEQAAAIADVDDKEFMQMYDIMSEKITQLARLKTPEEKRHTCNIEWPDLEVEQKKCTIF